ncbi:hypothetical protein CU098_005913 [Rhizopus stolonifer]|uniref:Ricin B lectin domain-containing protein n=1 Tax=Rhizopus stolonifer TaxID=4846 RepID=A0A367IVF9_RHIST|nr:hypothetical protein CU098_005913 [Rhizopus stolonifer]
MSIGDWFYIKHVASEKIVSCSIVNQDTQVFVVKPQFSDNELWRWDGQYLLNKSTGLVLDIRKGRLRFIEDTEICLCSKEDLVNQLWFVNTDYKPARHLFGREIRAKTPLGNTIHSVSNSDWVLEVCAKQEKVILFPLHSDPSKRQQQRWEFIPEEDMHSNEDEEPGLLFEIESVNSSIVTPVDYYSPAPSISTQCDSSGFAYGLTPARKRGSSQSSVSSGRKQSVEDMFNCQHFLYHPKQF